MDRELRHRLQGLERRVDALEIAYRASSPQGTATEGPDGLEHAPLSRAEEAEDVVLNAAVRAADRSPEIDVLPDRDASRRAAPLPTPHDVIGASQPDVPSLEALPLVADEVCAVPVATPVADVPTTRRKHTSPDSHVETPTRASPRATSRRSATSDWERFFGIAVMGRIGGAAVLLAAGYFAQLAYKQMGDVGKVLTIYAGSALFFGAGWAIRKMVAPKYLSVIWGAGMALAYLAGIAGHLRYELFDTTQAFLLLMGAVIVGTWHARVHRHEGLAIIALCGAFATPLLCGTSVDGPTWLLLFLACLHSWSVFCENAWGWTTTRWVGVAGTLAVGGLWVAKHGSVASLSTHLHAQLAVFFLVAPELWRVLRRQSLARASVERAFIVFVGVSGIQLLAWGAANYHHGIHVLPWLGTVIVSVWLAVTALLIDRAQQIDDDLASPVGWLARNVRHVLIAFAPIAIGLGAKSIDTGSVGLGNAVAIGLISLGLWVIGFVSGRLRIRTAHAAWFALVAGVVLAFAPHAFPLHTVSLVVALSVPACLVVLGSPETSRGRALGIGVALALTAAQLGGAATP